MSEPVDVSWHNDPPHDFEKLKKLFEWYNFRDPLGHPLWNCVPFKHLVAYYCQKKEGSMNTFDLFASVCQANGTSQYTYEYLVAAVTRQGKCLYSRPVSISLPAPLSSVCYSVLGWQDVADAIQYYVFRHHNGKFCYIGTVRVPTKFLDRNIAPDPEITVENFWDFVEAPEAPAQTQCAARRCRILPTLQRQRCRPFGTRCCQ